MPSVIAIIIGVLMIVYANPVAETDRSLLRRLPMMTLIYRLLVVLVTLLVVLELFSQKDLKAQATAAFVLIPFVLRVLMIA